MPGRGSFEIQVEGLAESLEGAAIPIGSAFELCQTARGDVRGRPAGAIEVYHAVCLILGGKPLGAPLLLTVGGLVTDFEAHGVSCVVREFYRVRGGRMPPWWTV